MPYQDCSLLWGCTCGRPSTAQLRFLLGWAYADAAAAAARPAAFGLLRIVLARRLVLPEVYDLMGRVQAAMVQAQVCVLQTEVSKPYSPHTSILVQ